MTWIPITTPSCVIICWKAPATPRSRSSTALAMLAASAGDAQPIPAPDSAREPMITRSEDPGATLESASIEAMMHSEPTSADARSPTRMATYPAKGPAMAKVSGRAIIRPPTRVSG
jgi:hypothetical protein